MIHDVLTRSANSLWPQIALIIFVLCFVGVIIWTYAGRKDRFQNQAALPLEDDSNSERTSGANYGR